MGPTTSEWILSKRWSGFFPWLLWNGTLFIFARTQISHGSLSLVLSRSEIGGILSSAVSCRCPSRLCQVDADTREVFGVSPAYICHKEPIVSPLSVVMKYNFQPYKLQEQIFPFSDVSLLPLTVVIFIPLLSSVPWEMRLSCIFGTCETSVKSRSKPPHSFEIWSNSLALSFNLKWGSITYSDFCFDGHAIPQQIFSWRHCIRCPPPSPSSNQIPSFEFIFAIVFLHNALYSLVTIDAVRLTFSELLFTFFLL